MLEGEPSAQPEVLSAVEQIFIEDVSVLHLAFPQPWPVTESMLLKNSPIAWGCYQYTLLLGYTLFWQSTLGILLTVSNFVTTCQLHVN